MANLKTKGTNGEIGGILENPRKKETPGNGAGVRLRTLNSSLVNEVIIIKEIIT